MAFSTGISLLPVARPSSFLSYSTAGITNSNYIITATATPNPDNYGQTGFATTGSVGISGSSSSGIIKFDFSGTYPNYTMTVYPDPNYITSSLTGTFTPQIRDSQGVVGNTSGVLSVSMSRQYTWTGVTSYTRGTISSGSSVFWNIRNTSAQINDVASSSVVGSLITSPNSWCTFTYPANNIASANEAKIDILSSTGSGSVAIATYINSSTISNNKSTGVYYTIGDTSNLTTIWGLRLTPSAGSTYSVTFRITFRNKLNNTQTSSVDLTLTATA